MGGGLIGPAASIKALTRQFENAKLRTKLTGKMQEIVNSKNTKNEQDIIDSDKQYDLVYILKESEDNPDLKMSLRSIEKFCIFKNVWIIGYKPSWLTNVKYLPTDQKGNKWKNSELNWRTACECDDISENFILMNDDFIALKPIRDWKNSLNVCLGSISKEASIWRKKQQPSRWQAGFVYAEELLRKCHAKTDYNYESHMPIMINRKKYLEFINMRPIQDFTLTQHVLHKRSIYKNLFPDNDLSKPHEIKDVKLLLGYDLTDGYLKEDWFSVFDDVIGNVLKFPKVNKFLEQMFPEKSKFEL